MARLRNRIRKADYFSDGELLRWPRDKRTTYSGLYALAEDSGCLEDDPFNWKLLLWPSPLDSDITVDLLEQWRDELLAAGKLIAYEVRGVRYFYLRSFHKHEHPRNPQSPSLPLPKWVRWVPPGEGLRGHYEVVAEPESHPKQSVQSPYSGCTDPVQAPQPSPVQSSPVQPLNPYVSESDDAPVDNSDDDLFDTDFWPVWPHKKGSKQLTRKRFAALGPEQQRKCVAAARYLAEAIDAGLVDPQYQPRAENFVGGTKSYWREWADGIPEHLTARGNGRRSTRALDSSLGALREVARQLDDEVGT